MKRIKKNQIEIEIEKLLIIQDWEEEDEEAEILKPINNK